MRFWETMAAAEGDNECKEDAQLAPPTIPRGSSSYPYAPVLFLLVVTVGQG